MTQGLVAFLATGSELASGCVINTSSPFMAERLFECGYETVEHRVVTDGQAVISQAITDLLARYDIVIVSGGLGPTSDDRTRFALAEALGMELTFREEVWQAIKHRILSLGLPIPDNNRSQALFPVSAVVLENKQGTAAGCYVTVKGKHVFMLPGPPHECRPMFLESVLPCIQKLFPAKWSLRKHWFLLGVSEGVIAEYCDPLVQNLPVEMGYRAEYPYLELKLFANDSALMENLSTQITTLVQDNLVGDKPASLQLQQELMRRNQRFVIKDTATGERIASRLLFPSTHPQRSSVSGPLIEVHVQGLQDFWLGQEADFHELSVEIITDNGTITRSRQIPHRGLRSLEMASEWVCWVWLQYLQSN